MAFKWHKVLKEGRENVEDDPRSGRPISSTNDQNVEAMQAVMAKDRRFYNRCSVSLLLPHLQAQYV